MAPILKVEGLCKDFGAGLLRRAGRLPALRDVDLEVREGETLGLVGESGCGKTTLARCILRLIEPTSGSISFDGEDLLALSPPALRAKRREFQIIFQNPLDCLDPRMTVGEILKEPYEVHRLGTRDERETWVQELLDAVALDREVAGRGARSLSGGQQQRVGIARALALKPRMLVADEPVSALDASVQAQVLNLLADLQRRLDLTLILISHSLAVVHYLCTRVAVMYLGRIVEEAPMEEFFRAPRHPYSRMLMDSVAGLKLADEPMGKGAAGELPCPGNPPAGCPFHPRCPDAAGRCSEDIPQLLACGPAAKVACFLYT